jgi:hypothetical protein
MTVREEKKKGAFMQSIHAGHETDDQARLFESPKSDDISALMLSMKADRMTTMECPSLSEFLREGFVVRSLRVIWNSSGYSSIRRLPRPSHPTQKEKTLNN